jgi:DNA adenine methylase
MRFLRYPGGKSRFLSFLINHLPTNADIKGLYIEPFVGGGSVFFYLRPTQAIISDLNLELIQLYEGIKSNPKKVWSFFKSFPEGKKAYYQIRDERVNNKSLYYKAARILYLNRTCFKGMWRHNQEGKFNVGYGGEQRRWVVTEENLLELSKILKKATIYNKDFEEIISLASNNDFLFLDPPYRPGEKSLEELHYKNGKFLFNEQVRLAKTLKEISKSKNIRWAMTNSSHREILNLYKDFHIIKIPIGTSKKLGIQTKDSKEVLIKNY